MFVTNLTRGPLGIDGVIILKPYEENRYVEDTPDLTDRVRRLKQANLVDVSYSEGLIKDSLVEEPIVEATEPIKVEEIVSVTPTENIEVVEQVVPVEQTQEMEAPVRNKRGAKRG